MSPDDAGLHDSDTNTGKANRQFDTGMMNERIGNIFAIRSELDRAKTCHATSFHISEHLEELIDTLSWSIVSTAPSCFKPMPKVC